MEARQFVQKPVWQRWRECPCGTSAQRDLSSAFLAAYLDPSDSHPSCAQPRYAACWEGREPGLRAAYEHAYQRASAGQHVPRSITYPRRQSAPAQKSKPSDTRARLPSQATGNVEAKQGTSWALARRGLRGELFSMSQHTSTPSGTCANVARLLPLASHDL